MKRRALFVIVALAACFAQTVDDATVLKATNYAIQAAVGLRNGMYDPASFTLLQATALAKQEKNGKTTLSGCLHFMGNNLVGGRLQRWEYYEVNKKDQLIVRYVDDHCYYKTDKVVIDVTSAVQTALSK